MINSHFHSIFLILFVLVSFNLSAISFLNSPFSSQNDTCIQIYEYPFSTESKGCDILKKSSGGIYTVSIKTDSIYIVNFDTNYEVIWSHSFKVAEIDPRWVHSVLDDNENILGVTYNFYGNTGPTYVTAFKFNTNSINVDWINNYYDPNQIYYHDFYYDSISNSAYAVGVDFNTGVGNNADAFIIEFDNNSGNLIFQKHFNYLDNDVFLNVIKYGNEFYINGRFGVSTYSNLRSTLTKLDQYGNENFTKFYNHSSSVNARYYSYGIKLLNNEVYLFSHGDKNGTSTTNTVANFLKTDLNGNPLLEVEYEFDIGNAEYVFESSIAENGFLFFGRYIDNNNTKAYIIKIDYNGNLIWAKSFDFGLGPNEWILDAEEINGEVIMIGQTANDNILFGRFLPIDDLSSFCFEIENLPVTVTNIINPQSYNISLTPINHSISTTDISTTVSPNQSVPTEEICISCNELNPQAIFNFDPVICENTCIIIENNSIDAQNYYWTFEGADIQNSNMEDPGELCFANQGNFNIQLVIENNGIFDTSSLTLTVNNSPEVNLGADTVLCNGQSLELSYNPLPDETFTWSNNSQYNNISVSNSGLYWIEVSNAFCSYSDSIQVDFEIVAVELGEDQSICSNDFLQLDATLNGASYLWQDQSTEPTFEVEETGWHWVNINLGNCYASDSIFIEVNPSPEIDLGEDQIYLLFR